MNACKNIKRNTISEANLTGANASEPQKKIYQEILILKKIKQ